MSVPFGNKLIAFVKTPLGIAVAIVLGVATACCCGGTVLGALTGDPEPKESQSPPPAIVSVPKTATPSPTEVVSSPPVITTTAPAPPAPPPTTNRPPAPRPTRTTAGPKPACHPNYSVCLPIVTDLDCGEISQRNFRVIGGQDPYRLDADNDGIACEQN